MAQQLQPLELDPESFKSIADLAYRESGLILSQEKATMIQSRLRKRLNFLNMEDFSTYSRFVHSEDGVPEREHLISALTTNVSHFFREKHHYDALCSDIIEPNLEGLKQGERLRIWSAGCSNGQEAVSMAISLLELAPEITNFDVRILATDIDTNVVRFARQGLYSKQDLNGVPKKLIEKYFVETSDRNNAQFEVRPLIRELIQFNHLNLLSPWPMKRRFDAIFCRNVVIYFDARTQAQLWPRFRNQLRSGGYLFLGHSERISNPHEHAFKISGPTTYKAN